MEDENMEEAEVPEEIKELGMTAMKIYRHLREHRPKHFQALSESGELKKYVIEADRECFERMLFLIGKRLPLHEARFTAEREFIYLPAEDEEDWHDRE